MMNMKSLTLIAIVLGLSVASAMRHPERRERRRHDTRRHSRRSEGVISSIDELKQYLDDDESHIKEKYQRFEAVLLDISSEYPTLTDLSCKIPLRQLKEFLDDRNYCLMRGKELQRMFVLELYLNSLLSQRNKQRRSFLLAKVLFDTRYRGNNKVVAQKYVDKVRSMMNVMNYMDDSEELLLISKVKCIDTIAWMQRNVFNQHEKAVSIWEEAISMMEDNLADPAKYKLYGDCFYYIGMTYLYDIREFTQAAKYLQKAELAYSSAAEALFDEGSIDEQRGFALYFGGLASYDMRRYEDAIASWEKAVDVDKRSADPVWAVRGKRGRNWLKTHSRYMMALAKINLERFH